MKPPIVFVLLHIICAGISSAEPYNYGRDWVELSAPTRSAYVNGVIDGVNLAFDESQREWLPASENHAQPPSPQVERVRKRIFTMFEPATLVPVMTDLYRDPANALLPFRSVLYLARDKLLGENIDAALISARKEAVRNWDVLHGFKQ
jgi:hypothetical protein